MNEMLTTAELVEWLKISRPTLHLLRKDGLPYLKIGRSVRFEKEKVEAWLKEKNK